MQQRRAGGLLTEISITFMFFVIMASGVFIITMSLRNRQRLRELAMRERIAMIEKGLVPSPEVDPGRFDQFDRLERLVALRRRVSPSASRYRSLGIMMIGFGLAFMVLLTFAGGVVGAGFGIGGAFMILGAAMVVNSLVMSRTEISDAHPSAAPMPPPPPEPPTNVAP
jgi:Domain of unknown function (DUF6249)